MLSASALATEMEKELDKIEPKLAEKDARAARKASLDAIAKAVVDYLKANLQITILPAAGGLQTTTGPGSPTGPPAGPIPLPPGSVT